MNAKQSKMVEFLRTEILDKDGSCTGGYEYKKFEVKEMAVLPSDKDGEALVFVLSVVGLIGDEGTMAAVFCRRTRHICINKRGRLHLLNAKRGPRGGKKKVTGPRSVWALTEG